MKQINVRDIEDLAWDLFQALAAYRNTSSSELARIILAKEVSAVLKDDTFMGFASHRLNRPIDELISDMEDILRARNLL